jgi:elongation factor P--beta-lysine ligase
MPTWPVLKARGKMLAAIRQFFEARSVTEVSTPSLSRSGTVDVQLASFEVSDKAGKLFLQTSPASRLPQRFGAEIMGASIIQNSPCSNGIVPASA